MSEGPTIGDWTQYEWIPDDASSFPAMVRLRNAAWMVYYEPYTVVQRERADRLELQAENAKLRELVDELYPLADYGALYAGELDRAHDLMRELGLEVG